MAASLLIAFREGLEAALIVGIVLSYLNKMGHGAHKRYAWAGVLGAVLASVAVALGIQAVGAELEGTAEQLFEGTTMLLAVIVLTWMIFWMRYQARTLKSSLEGEIQSAVNTERKWGLAAVTFIAVFREGVETALFLSAAAFATDGASTFVGALLGLGLAVLVGYTVYASAVRLDMRQFFNVTSILMLVFAAGMLAHAVHEYQEAGLIPTFIEHVWNINPILDEHSPVGEILNALIGYNGNPSLLEVLSYIGYWGFALFGVRWWVNRKVASYRMVQEAA
ncbi:MAG: FTR1 family protein [Anaerolineae bacterium]|nr:FTR1 family protein [Anaerolineae bacterium]